MWRWLSRFLASRCNSKSVLELYENPTKPCIPDDLLILFEASNDFVNTTLETKDDVELGSRAVIFLRLAQEYKKPLSLVRQSDQREEMARRFQAEFQAAPWIRTKAEYDEFVKVKESLR